jgi:N6-adenosine-specific RNA methylase IME4
MLQNWDRPAVSVGTSANPIEYYNLTEKLYPGRRYIELFARGEPRKGWTRWGDEV